MQRTEHSEISGDVPASPCAPTSAGLGGAPTDAPTDWSMLPVADGSEDSLVMVLWRMMRQEPALMVSAGYIFLSLLGLWSSYFFYRGFQLSILDYLQVSDFLVAGLRDPSYALILLLGIALAVLLSWPDTVRRRNPARVEALRARHWGWRVLFSRLPLMSWDLPGVRPLTGMTLSVACFMALGAAGYATSKGENIRDGGGTRVQVWLNGDSAALGGNATLLGSSSAFVFLWWPAQRRAEAVPISSIRRLQSAPLSPKRPVKAASAR